MKEQIILPDFSPQGKIKIELFDELTGKKLNEIKTHNYISSGVKNYLFKLAMKNLFTNNRPNGVDLTDYMKDPFEILYLTYDADNSQPDEMNDYYIKGTQIGYAYSTGTYSGDDIKRGTFNSAESFITLDQVHMVFDFPTHAGNGTFNNIYFAPSDKLFSKYQLYRLEFPKLEFTRDYYNVLSVQKYGNKIYVLYQTSSIPNAVDRIGVFNAQTFKMEEESIFNTSRNENDIYVRDGYVYVTNFYQDSDPVKRFNISTGEEEEIIDTYNDLNLSSSAYGITYDENKNRWLVNFSGEIASFNDNWEILERKNLERTNQLFYHDGKIFTGYITMLRDDLSGVDDIGALYSEAGFIDDYQVTREGYLVPKSLGGFGSRIVLDSPVTKTSTNTMKITYDFILE